MKSISQSDSTRTVRDGAAVRSVTRAVLIRRLSIAAVSSTFGVAVVAALGADGIEGSKHDFSNKEWAGGDACSACHGTESEPPKAAPPWDPDADLNRTYGTSLVQSQRAGTGSTMCLRCHDGTIARDTIAAATKERLVSKEHPGLFGVGHGTGDHPVGAEYPQFGDDFRPASIVVSEGAVALPGGKVECVSCHDPHAMSGLPYMLVKSNARSALCLTCHRK